LYDEKFTAHSQGLNTMGTHPDDKLAALRIIIKTSRKESYRLGIWWVGLRIFVNPSVGVRFFSSVLIGGAIAGAVRRIRRRGSTSSKVVLKALRMSTRLSSDHVKINKSFPR
jgi:hypothetical protein